jgi:exopolysaccharide/PEP-CTERM locus tyrosine autokinase
MRRSGAAGGARPDAAGPRAAQAAVTAAAAGAAAAPVSVTLEGPAEPDYPTKRIAIDTAALRKAGYLPEESHQRQFADYYRRIKRPLIEKAIATGAPADMRLILVTSALPGDGKTFTSINLAMSIARERDVSVLLVDADLPKGHISRAFGVDGQPGLLDALQDETLDVESLVVRTDVRGLDILPAGKMLDTAPELIASARMAQVAARLSGRNPRRLALFDSSPLLVSSEARALVQIPGQVLLVVRAGKTPRQALLDAITHVDKKKLQGLVLNEAPVGRGDGYYGYSYYGAGDDPAAAG